MRPLPKSDIPDGEVLIKYCYPGAFPDGQTEIPVSLFDQIELSCDWKLFRADPRTSYHVSEGKNRIIEITVCDDIRSPKNPRRSGEVVQAWRQQIIYDPVSEKDDTIHGANLAHSLIIGRKKAAVKEAIVANAVWYDV